MADRRSVMAMALQLFALGQLLLIQTHQAAASSIRVPIVSKRVPVDALGGLRPHLSSSNLGGSPHMDLRNQVTVYTGSIEVGTAEKKQLFNVVMDTGSSDLWVFSAQTRETHEDYLNYYNHSLSPTYKKDGRAWAIQYGKGACAGVLSVDTVTLAGVSVTDQIFAEVMNYTDLTSEDQPLDGIVGLAFKDLTVDKTDTLMDMLYKQEIISTKTFSVFMSPDYDSPGELLLGEPDLSYAPKGVTYLDIITSGGVASSWFVGMAAVKADGEDLEVCDVGYECIALVDTGTSFIGVPSSKMNTLLSTVTASRSDCQYDPYSGTVVCSSQSCDSLPSLAFNLGGRDFPLKPEQYCLLMTGGGAILAFIDIGDLGLWILGDTFLKQYYTIYDMENLQIGIANPLDTLTASWTLVLVILAIVFGTAASGFTYVFIKHKGQDNGVAQGNLLGGADANGLRVQLAQN